SGVTPAGPASPPADTVDGQTLVWTSLPDLAPGQMLTATIPVIVSPDLPSFLDLVNNAYFEYSNTEGYTFDLATSSDTTQVQRRAGYVDGYAFVDSVGDGIFNGDEARLSGVQISLPSALAPTVTTDGDGYYRFRIEVEQPISVTAGLPTDYFRTTPGTVYLENTFEVTNTVNFGYASTSSPFGVIHGVVFADENHDGNQDGGENGLPGVTISATAAVTSPVLTRDYGIYTLRFDVPGTVTVQETNPAGYVSTTPDLIQTDVVTGSDNGSPWNFGDFLGIRIEGKVFDDLNVNGQDDGEPGLAGAQVAAGSDSQTTAAGGLFTLYARAPGGRILVTESDPAGYVSTDAVPGSGMSRVDANTLSIDNPVSGTVYQGALFGDISASAVITISGEVWDDNGAGDGLAANGQRDGLEPGLAGVWLSASSGMVTQSDGAGQFTLYAPPGVPITVTEQNSAGYISTNAIPGNNAQKIDNDNLLISNLSAGLSSTGNQFGDAQEAAVAGFSGVVWNDDGAGGGVANDGLWQVGLEQPLPGALIRLSSGMSVTTGLNGAYLLYGPPGAAITITEQNPAGYTSSGASAGAGAAVVDADTIVVSAPTAAQLYAGNNFGDLLPADLTIAKLDDPDPVIAGTLLTYILNLANDGPSYAQAVVIGDVLPPGVTYAGLLSQPAALSGPTVDGASLTWEATSLESSFRGSIVFQVAVAPDLAQGHVLTNTASLASNMPDLAPESNTAMAETAVARHADLSIAKADDPDPVVAGESLTYILQVDNHGPSDASSVLVTDTLPAEVSLASYQASQGAFNESTGVWDVGDLALDASAALTIVVNVDSGAPVSLTNYVEVTAAEVDPDNQNNTFSEETAVIRQVDLTLTKADSPDPVVAGESLTYVLELTNNGPSDATGVTVTDTLPDEVRIASFDATQGTFNQTSGVWDVGGLALDAGAMLTIVVDVDSNAPISLTNQATATADQPELNEADNTAVEVTDVIRQVDLALTKADSPDPVVAGESLTYILELTNNGPSDATGVIVTDTLPAEVSFTSFDATQGTFDEFTGLWDVGGLALNASATLTIVVDVDSNAPVSLSNQATATSDQPELNEADNTAVEVTDVIRQVDLTLTKADNPDPVVAGESLTYVLTIGNGGPSDATGVSVTDTLPDEVRIASFD
ncbi:MAG: SdrD B-like domain-containing protein, partial [Chloroflexota bacterium]